MDKKFLTVAPAAAADRVRRLLQGAPHGELFVVDDDGVLTGTITFHDLRETAFDTDRDDAVTAADLARGAIHRCCSLATPSIAPWRSWRPTTSPTFRSSRPMTTDSSSAWSTSAMSC